MQCLNENHICLQVVLPLDWSGAALTRCGSLQPSWVCPTWIISSGEALMEGFVQNGGGGQSLLIVFGAAFGFNEL